MIFEIDFRKIEDYKKNNLLKDLEFFELAGFDRSNYYKVKKKGYCWLKTAKRVFAKGFDFIFIK